MRKLVFASLLAFVASSAFAGELLIPAVYRGAGAFDTLWRTELVVANVTEGPQPPVVLTTLTLHRDNGETVPIELHLSPHEIYAIPDAVREWFNVENGGGIVRITWDGEDSRIMARARIYNAGEHGQYGQGMQAIDPTTLVSHQYLSGVTGVDGNRTNVGISNPSTTEALVWIELFDTSGTSRGMFATAIPARSYRQYNDIFSYFQAGPLNAAMVHVISTDVPVYAYASIVRNDTGDATFVAGQ